LFIWKQKGQCVDLLEKSHSVIKVTIFMSAVKYTWCICRTRVIVFMYLICSQNLDFKFRLVCPTYALWQVLHVILYILLFSCSCNRVCAMGFMRWCYVVVVLNAMPIFIFFNKLVIFLIFGLWKVNVVQIYLSFLLVFLLLTLCSICWLSFSSRCCGKLLFLAIDCFISHSVCFLSGLRGKECILVMWNLNAAIFCSMG